MTLEAVLASAQLVPDLAARLASAVCSVAAMGKSLRSSSFRFGRSVRVHLHLRKEQEEGNLDALGRALSSDRCYALPLSDPSRCTPLRL